MHPFVARSIRRRKVVHWFLEANLAFWVLVLGAFAWRRQWDGHTVGAAAGLFIAALLQFISYQYLYKPALRDEVRFKNT